MNTTQKKMEEHQRLEQILATTDSNAITELPPVEEQRTTMPEDIKLTEDFTTGEQPTINESLAEAAGEALTAMETFHAALVAAPTKEKAPRKKSKQQEQAEQVHELLKQGPVTIEQLKVINPAYPSDPITFARNLLELKINTTRAKGQKTTYELVK